VTGQLVMGITSHISHRHGRGDEDEDEDQDEDRVWISPVGFTHSFEISCSALALAVVKIVGSNGVYSLDFLWSIQTLYWSWF
jgi:hypothetical protein